MHICLFDIDGTLLNTGGAGQAAMEATLEAEFGVTAPTEGISTAGRTDRGITADLFRYHGLGDGDDIHQRFLSAYCEHLPQQLQQRDGLVLPGVPELLDRLSSRDDVTLGLLTGNFEVGEQLKLEFYGLHHYFDFGGFGDRHVHRDDVAHEALAEVHQRHNDSVDMNRVWVIGDTPADVQCGRAIGAKVVAVATGMFEYQVLEAAKPDHLFVDFADAEPLLGLLES